MKEKDPVKIGGDFYNQVKSGYHYDLSQDSITYLNLYSEAWAEEVFSDLLLAFLKNDFEMKVKAYQSLAASNLLFLEKEYNSIRVD